MGGGLTRAFTPVPSGPSRACLHNTGLHKPPMGASTRCMRSISGFVDIKGRCGQSCRTSVSTFDYRLSFRAITEVRNDRGHSITLRPSADITTGKSRPSRVNVLTYQYPARLTGYPMTSDGFAPSPMVGLDCPGGGCNQAIDGPPQQGERSFTLPHLEAV